MNAHADRRRPLLLVVDDEPVNLHLMSHGLQEDFRLRTADSGERALEAATAGERPELIVLDVMMPGMDGYEVCRRLKTRPETRDIPVIFVTSQSDEAAEMRGLAVGAVDFIAKPVNLRVTRARILTHINLKRNADRLARMSREDALTGIANRRSFDETLTLHRLGVFAELGTSLKTTNALESIHARVESRTAKVDHWKNSEQKQRWLATALLDLEPRLRRIRNYRALPLLREAIKRQMQGVKKSAA